MADVSGIQWRLDFVQDIYKSVNDVLSSLTGKGDPTVCIDKLCMDKTEVTESAYAEAMGKSLSSNGPQMPVTLVSYKNASEYCKRVGKRLPTYAEWGKFAGSNEFATADGKLVDDNGKKEANFGSKGPMTVKSFRPNSNGMYDMTGNVAEWVGDEALRGGSWFVRYTDDLRVTYRETGIFSPIYWSSDVGFRCVAPEGVNEDPTKSGGTDSEIVWKGKLLNTNDDFFEALGGLANKAEGQEFMELYRKVNPKSADENVGYISGYFSREVMVRIQEYTGTVHPLFGKAGSTEEITDQNEVFRMGIKMGQEAGN